MNLDRVNYILQIRPYYNNIDSVTQIFQTSSMSGCVEV